MDAAGEVDVFVAIECRTQVSKASHTACLGAICATCGDLCGAGATAGSDSLMGDAGNDSILGGLGTEKLFGGLDDDLLFGEESNGTLTSGDGVDRLSGGAGTNLRPDSVAGTDQVDAFAGEPNALLAVLP